MERELAQVSGWEGRCRAGAGARVASFTKGLTVERHPRSGRRLRAEWGGEEPKNPPPREGVRDTGTTSYEVN